MADFELIKMPTTEIRVINNFEFNEENIENKTGILFWDALIQNGAKTEDIDKAYIDYPNTLRSLNYRVVEIVNFSEFDAGVTVAASTIPVSGELWENEIGQAVVTGAFWAQSDFDLKRFNRLESIKNQIIQNKNNKPMRLRIWRDFQKQTPPPIPLEKDFIKKYLAKHKE